MTVSDEHNDDDLDIRLVNVVAQCAPRLSCGGWDEADTGRARRAVAEVDEDPRVLAAAEKVLDELERAMLDLRMAALGMGGATSPARLDERALRERIRSGSTEQRRAALLAFLEDAVADLVGGTGVRPARHTPFRSLGLDSLAAVMLRERLEEITGLRLEVTTVFDNPTPDDLAAAVADRLDEAPADLAEIRRSIARLSAGDRRALTDDLQSVAQPATHSSAEDLFRRVDDELGKP